MTQPLVEVRDLYKYFPIHAGMFSRHVGDVKAVDGVDFTIAPGETLGLVGESGSGKTTIGRLILRLLSESKGEILFDGQDVTKMNASQIRRLRREMQIIFQDPYASLNPRMTVGDIVGEPLRIHGLAKGKEVDDKVRELLQVVGLRPYHANRFPHEFSGGQRQRLGFARALILSPKLIVADEPVSALDVSIQAQILNMMRDLQRELGLTYLFISHDLAVVRYLSSQIGVMYLGKLVEVGPADEVYLRPAHPYTKGLLDSAPVADPEAEHAKVRAGISGELPSAIHPPSGCRFRTRCPLAEDICAEVEPPLRPFSTSGHLAACHFPLQTALSDQPASPVAEAQTP